MGAENALGPQLTLPPTFFRPPRAVRSQAVEWETGRTMRQCMAPGRRWRQSIAAGALFVGAFGLFSVPTKAAAQGRDVVEVQGNRLVDAETVRSYFHAPPHR